jgi:transcriptional regulator with XRE-family HTH domain
MNIGSAIRLCRNSRKLSRAELARRAKLSVSYLSLLERSQRDPPLSTITRLAAALNIPIEILFFLGAERGELAGIDEDLAGRLAMVALDLLNEPEPAQTSLPI